MASPMYGLKGPKIMSGDYAPHFPLRLAKKDMDFAVELAAKLGERVPLAEAAKAQMAIAMDAGLGNDDFSAVAKPRVNKYKRR